MTDAREIANKLTGEQRGGICLAQPDEWLMGFYGLRWTDPPLVDPVGVSHPIFGSHYRLNAIGLEVRAILQEGTPNV